MAYSSSEKAVLKTIIYSDIFGFPNAKEELWQFLISDKKILREQFDNALQKLRSVILSKDGYYCLQGKEESITRRKHNTGEATKKLRLAKHAAYTLSHIPTVSFIGLSGAVAVGNVEKDDDVDLFIIAKKGTLFTTRALILLILEVLGLRRARNDANPSNKICVNMLIDETALSWQTKKRDLYIAREIIQMKPLFERDNMYRRFMMSNKWVKEFFPNARMYPVIIGKSSDYFVIAIFTKLVTIWPMELLMRKIQRRVMKRSQTTEVISHQFLAFHPRDYRGKTLRAFDKKIKELRVNN